METWKDIKEFEGIYQVSNYGRVRSLDRVDSRGAKHKSRIKKPGRATRKGYEVMCLGKNCKQYMRYVHRLVVEAFIGEIPKDMVVNHINHDPMDNRVENLEIVTRSRNAVHGKEEHEINDMVMI